MERNEILKNLFGRTGKYIGSCLTIAGLLMGALDLSPLNFPPLLLAAIGAIILAVSLIRAQEELDRENEKLTKENEERKKETQKLNKKLQTIKSELGIVNRSVTPFPSGKYLHGETIRLCDFVVAGEKPIIEGKTFEECTLLGPAMVYLFGVSTVHNCSFDGGMDSLFIEVEADRVVIGVIGLKDCVFRKCRFRGIGVIGPSDLIKRWREGFVQSDESATNS